MIEYLNVPKKMPVVWDKIKILVMDCDGVLSDGRIVYGSDKLEIKEFDVADGMGFMLLARTDIITAVITGRSSEALAMRCADLKIKHLHQGIARKLDVLDKLLAELKLDYSNVVYVGDDWNDVPCLLKVGYAVAPANAHEDVKKIVDMVCEKPGGSGAIREVIDFILKKKGIYEKTVDRYLNDVGSVK